VWPRISVRVCSSTPPSRSGVALMWQATCSGAAGSSATSSRRHGARQGHADCVRPADAACAVPTAVAGSAQCACRPASWPGQDQPRHGLCGRPTPEAVANFVAVSEKYGYVLGTPEENAGSVSLANLVAALLAAVAIAVFAGLLRLGLFHLDGRGRWWRRWHE
jgi:hypothetical protein